MAAGLTLRRRSLKRARCASIFNVISNNVFARGRRGQHPPQQLARARMPTLCATFGRRISRGAVRLADCDDVHDVSHKSSVQARAAPGWS